MMRSEKKLLMVSALIFKKTFEVALAMESTEKNSLELSVSQENHVLN